MCTSFKSSTDYSSTITFFSINRSNLHPMSSFTSLYINGSGFCFQQISQVVLVRKKDIPHKRFQVNQGKAICEPESRNQ